MMDLMMVICQWKHTQMAGDTLVYFINTSLKPGLKPKSHRPFIYYWAKYESTPIEWKIKCSHLGLYEAARFHQQSSVYDITSMTLTSPQILLSSPNERPALDLYGKGAGDYSLVSTIDQVCWVGGGGGESGRQRSMWCRVGFRQLSPGYQSERCHSIHGRL